MEWQLELAEDKRRENFFRLKRLKHSSIVIKAPANYQKLIIVMHGLKDNDIHSFNLKAFANEVCLKDI